MERIILGFFHAGSNSENEDCNSASLQPQNLFFAIKYVQSYFLFGRVYMLTYLNYQRKT